VIALRFCFDFALTFVADLRFDLRQICKELRDDIRSHGGDIE